jgi:GTP-binding protein
MVIKQAAFAGSYPSEAQCPSDHKPEYAFIGRSNVGKSSLVNMLTDRKNMAHTSKTPGKTQLLNYYLINAEWYLVDLPGYGYARISKRKRREWEVMIQGYLTRRVNLQCAFILIDSNVPPQQIDIEFINWLGEKSVPFVIVYTKTDRLKPEVLEANIQAIQQELLLHWNELPRQFVSSAVGRMGGEEILAFIDDVNTKYFETV